MNVFVIFFFFKQKTAYEMRISDWSSDVCSSDLTSTETIGGSIAGSSRRVRRENAMMPSTISSRLTTVAKTGRRMETSDSSMAQASADGAAPRGVSADRKSTRLNSSH